MTDTLGLLLALLVTAASAQDSVAGARLLDQVAAEHPGIRKPGTKGFTPIPKRWAVERTYGWLMLHRRLARDYEALPARPEALMYLATTDLMARRLTNENTISWHDPKKAAKHTIPG